MNIHVKFPLGFALSILAATSAAARGPLPQPWLVYPAQSMESCQQGTAPPQIAVRCDDLLNAYARELEACVPMRRGGAIHGTEQIALQEASPACAESAAIHAAGMVK